MSTALCNMSAMAVCRRCAQWALLACLLTVLAGCRVSLYSDLSEEEANVIVNSLSAEGVRTFKEQGGEKGWRVAVGEEEVARALEVLRANDLPGDRYVSMGDIFQRQGLVSTPSEERMRYVYAVSQELSHTLRKIDGVVAARVHVVIPENDPLSDKVRPASAAVFIKHKSNMDLPLLVPAVKQLVSHSVEGLSYDAVALSLFEVRKAAAKPAASAMASGGANAGQALPWKTVSGLLAAALAALLVTPMLLRKRGLDWGAWLRQAFRPR